MATVSRKTRQKSWRTGRATVSVLADMALKQERVAALLANLRERHLLTQEQAAAKVGVTLRQWQRWEAGESMPYSRNLDLIAGQFDFDVSDFFGEPQARANDQLTEGERAILEALDGIVKRLERLERQRPRGAS